MTESLAQELAGFGVKVTLVEPGGFDTDWAGASAIIAEAQPQYAALHEGMAAQRKNYASPKPVGFQSAILKVVDADKPPLRVFFGEQPLHIASRIYQQRLDQWNEWAPVSREAEGK
jgi:NAD(P)-dependent dehydrogenase (short-subunit alcohol dehydrogenase family)